MVKPGFLDSALLFERPQDWFGGTPTPETTCRRTCQRHAVEAHLSGRNIGVFCMRRRLRPYFSRNNEQSRRQNRADRFVHGGFSSAAICYGDSPARSAKRHSI